MTVTVHSRAKEFFDEQLNVSEGNISMCQFCYINDDSEKNVMISKNYYKIKDHLKIKSTKKAPNHWASSKDSFDWHKKAKVDKTKFDDGYKYVPGKINYFYQLKYYLKNYNYAFVRTSPQYTM